MKLTQILDDILNEIQDKDKFEKIVGQYNIDKNMIPYIWNTPITWKLKLYWALKIHKGEEINAFQVELLNNYSNISHKSINPNKPHISNMELAKAYMEATTNKYDELNVIKTYSSGLFWTLLDESQYAEIGCILGGNCLDDPENNLYGNSSLKLYALMSKRGADVHLLMTLDGSTIIELKGSGNYLPHEKYIDVLIDFIRSNKWAVDITVDNDSDADINEFETRLLKAGIDAYVGS